MFLGGVIWIGSHELDPFKPIASPDKPLEVQVVSLDWKWLFIYPDAGRRERQRAGRSRRRAGALLAHLGSVMNMFFVPQLGSMIDTMNGMVTQLHLQADQPGEYYGQSAQFSGDGFSDMNFMVRAVPARRVCTMGCHGAPEPDRRWTATSYRRARAAEQQRTPLHLSHGRSGPVHADRDPAAPARPGPAGRARAARRFIPARSAEMFGKLTWDAIPWDQPIPLVAGSVVVLIVLAVLAWVVLKGYLPYLWREWITSVDHKRIGVMYALLGAGDAAARLHRRDHDALAAGGRVPRAPAICRPSTTTRSSPRTARS